jgi:sigma-B regulation protein RsbU (phosphoserine phosphatase)
MKPVLTEMEMTSRGSCKARWAAVARGEKHSQSLTVLKANTSAQSLTRVAESSLQSWTEIAVYLGRDVRTVQRWEKREGLPVHRHFHEQGAPVYAFRQEVDTWLENRPTRVNERFCLDHLTSAEQRALESDLFLAARIQRALLPKPGLAPAGWDVRYHYQPAGLVSGDYCDLFETDSGLFLTLGDVSGKGVAASMLMSHLHATFRSLAEAGLPLDCMVEDANRIFCESTLAGQFATLVVGRAAHDGSVEFVNAGHLPVLHIDGDGATPMDSTGVPLGMFSHTRFAVNRLTLTHGDTLFLYTDGLTEARNRAGAEYGLHRVRTLATQHTGIEPAGLISDCLEDLLSFREGLKQTDDLTLLAVRRPK